MTWRRYTSILVVIFGLKWLLNHRGEELAAYVVVVLFAVVAVIGYWRHVRRQQTELAILQADADERAVLLAKLPSGHAATMRLTLRSFEDLDLSVAPPPMEFTYPPASRSLSAVLFWLTVALAGGFLLPVARGAVGDRGSATLLVAIAGVMVLAIVMHRLFHEQIGARVRVDQVGLTAISADSSTIRLDWSEIIVIRHRRWIGAVDYESISGERIRVWLTLIDFAYFVQLTLIHQYRRSTTGVV